MSTMICQRLGLAKTLGCAATQHSFISMAQTLPTSACQHCVCKHATRMIRTSIVSQLDNLAHRHKPCAHGDADTHQSCFYDYHPGDHTRQHYVRMRPSICISELNPGPLLHFGQTSLSKMSFTPIPATARRLIPQCSFSCLSLFFVSSPLACIVMSSCSRWRYIKRLASQCEPHSQIDSRPWSHQSYRHTDNTPSKILGRRFVRHHRSLVRS